MILLKKYLFIQIHNSHHLRYKIYAINENQSMEKYAEKRDVLKIGFATHNSQLFIIIHIEMRGTYQMII